MPQHNLLGRYICLWPAAEPMTDMTNAPRQSELTCPSCSFVELVTMPEDACIYFHECTFCGVLIRPKSGDCCVLCSYGSVPCPVRQEEERTRSDGASAEGSTLRRGKSAQ